MKTNEFVSELRRAPENQLVFVDGNGHAVHAGYHLTELKAASLDTVDCGGQANQWQETIIQLWVPANPDNDYMSADKFLKIFDKARHDSAKLRCGDSRRVRRRKFLSIDI
jgi:hypothetical protein